MTGLCFAPDGRPPDRSHEMVVRAYSTRYTLGTSTSTHDW
jgi:hypothetical protein